MTITYLENLDPTRLEDVSEPPDLPGVLPDPEELKRAQWAAYGFSGAVLEALSPRDCRQCARTIVTQSAIRKLPQGTRKRMRRDGVLISEARGLCSFCFRRVKDAGDLESYPPEVSEGNVRLEDRMDLQAEWDRTVAAGGHVVDLAGRINVTPEGLRVALNRIGVHPERKVRADVAEREYIIEEVTFLISCGLGVHEIAQKFSFTDEDLIERFRWYRGAGYTSIDLQFQNIEERKAAA